MIASQKLLVKDGVTDGGSRIELISWTDTDSNGERFMVRQIDVDDKMVCQVRVDLSADPNGWASEQLYSTFSLMF